MTIDINKYKNWFAIKDETLKGQIIVDKDQDGDVPYVLLHCPELQTGMEVPTGIAVEIPKPWFEVGGYIVGHANKLFIVESIRSYDFEMGCFNVELGGEGECLLSDTEATSGYSKVPTQTAAPVTVDIDGKQFSVDTVKAALKAYVGVD